jgi:hypothetical protein
MYRHLSPHIEAPDTKLQELELELRLGWVLELELRLGWV